MIYLSGTYSKALLPLLDTGRYGLLAQPKVKLRHRVGNPIWAVDNGCFTDPDSFDAERFISWLSSCDLSRCLFATAPDLLANSAETLRRAMPVLPRIQQLGIRAALVAQNGLVVSDTPWSALDALFVGGTTEWKFSQQAADLTWAAKDMGKWVHVGRINSEKGVNRAHRLGADSVDGNFLRFSPDANVKRLERWFRQQKLELRA